MMGHLSSPNLIIFFDPAPASDGVPLKTDLRGAHQYPLNENGNGKCTQTRNGNGTPVDHQHPEP